jgi:RimJ/RimL family protein N-acetyltransferase
MEHVLAHARTVVSQVHLCVVTENEAARRLYQRLGFTSYGIEPRSLRIGDRYYDEDLMVWRAD